MKTITLYDRISTIVGAVITQNVDPILHKKVIAACSSAFGTDTKDNHDKDYPYLINLYRPEEDPTVISAYRANLGCNAETINGEYNLYTAEFFEYTEAFKKMLPYSAEFGRSFISPDVNSLPRTVQIHCFRALWTTAIAPFIQECERHGIHYFFGQVSIPQKGYTPDEIKEIIAMYVANYGSKEFFKPKKPLSFDGQEFTAQEVTEIAKQCGFIGDGEKDFNMLKTSFRNRGKSIPMLLEKYPKLCGWNPDGIICNMPTESHVGTYDIPFCMDSNLFTQEGRADYFSLVYKQNAFTAFFPKRKRKKK